MSALAAPIPSEEGERPGAEHRGGATWWHSRIRYLFARQLAHGRRALDLACGNGFGTVLLAEVADSVVGADRAPEAIEVARQLNGAPRVRYEALSGGALPFADGAFDLVVCLETLEHLRAADQPGFVAELVRVLAPEGLLVLSTPDRDAELAHGRLTGAPNPYHLHTPSAEELDTYLAPVPHRLAFVEVDQIATLIVPVDDDPAARARALAAPEVAWEDRERATPVSVLRVCARSEAALEPARRAAPPVVFRSDLQRLSMLALALTSARLPDIGGLPLEQQAVLVADRLSRMEARLEHVEREGARVAENVSQLNHSLTLRGVLGKLRRLAGGR